MPRVRPGEIDTLLALRANGKLLVGRERVTLLEAVIAYGSITKAAEIAGFSYKTAWDAVNAINNLLPRQAFITHTGGPKGGGVEVTPEGRRLLSTFRRLEAKLGQISSAIATEGLETDDFSFLMLTMKLSARNALHCSIIEIKPAPVNVEVILQVSPGVVISAIVTNASVVELSLVPEKSVLALVNASSVMLAPAAQALRVSARNKIPGRVLDRFEGGSEAEVVVDIGRGKTMTSIMTTESADAAGVHKGAEVCAIFLSSNVILASD
ncbi:TOBE domain-containing protein [Methylocella silvestris]|uniref:Molybdenum-dependent transcriptional regulator n=1 Tax=Methylocella silvestris TaxID=199596 RepID=A0A2J7TC19_METSI|nr:TOBE domain-containing protein [Methylocella silvestris]PNG24312.1 molybdenum-dependent transcriptional regulator [Methylocella silvestris]